MRSVTWAVVCSVLAVATACGGGRLTLTEYSTEVAALVQELDHDLDARAQTLFSNPPNVEDTRRYLEARVDGYETVLEGVDRLDPPVEAEELHEAFRDILDRLVVAERARAQFAATIESVDDLDQLWEGPESQAVDAVTQEIFELCLAAQERVDATAEREGLEELPWVPPEMKEVVRVAFGCPES